MDDERPQTDWEARVAKAKREGSWDRDPDDLPSPYPPAVKRKRFLVGFVLTLVVGMALGALAHVLLGRPGSPWSPDGLLDGVIRGVFPALMIGWLCTRGPRAER